MKLQLGYTTYILHEFHENRTDIYIFLGGSALLPALRYYSFKFCDFLLSSFILVCSFLDFEVDKWVSLASAWVL